MLNKILLILLTINCSLLTVNAQWVQVLSPGTVRSIVYNGNNIFAAAQQSGVYLSTDIGETWTQIFFNSQPLSLTVNGNNIFAGTYPNTGVYLSTNNGTNWTQTSFNDRTVGQLASNGSYVFASAVTGITGYGVFSTTNNGANWIQSLNSQWVRALAANGNYVFAGTNSNGVYLSTDNGTSWTQTSLNNRTLNSLVLNGNNIFAGTYQYGVYLSTDNGTSWTQTSLNNEFVWSLAINGSNVFAGTNNGVFISTNNGSTWTPRNEGLVATFVYSLRVINNYIFAGTESSIYKRPLGELVGIKPISEQVPVHYALKQNYPNPFNPTTRIKFDLPAVGAIHELPVQLKIYDMLGREIATLLNERLKPGTYEVQWDATNYPSGVYYYQLTAGDYAETKRMVLIK